MAQTIKIKRTSTGNNPSGLAFGELAYVTQVGGDGDDQLWVGDSVPADVKIVDPKNPTNWFIISDNTDLTKQLDFDLTGITTSTVRTLTMADQDIDLTPTTGDFQGAGDNITLTSGNALRTATGAGNTALLQAYDVDGTSYTTFATLTANNTPTMDLSTSVTIGSNAILDSTWTGSTNVTTLGVIATGTWEGTTIDELQGGTGFDTYTTGDILYASASNVLSKLGVGSNGDVLTLTAGVPAWETPTGGGNVSNTGTPADGQIAVWTNTTTIEGDAALTFDTTDDTLLTTNVRLASTGALQTSQSAGNTLLLRAYDVDGTSYTTFATLTANNTPTMDLAAAVTIGGNTILDVSDFSAKGDLLVGTGSGTFQALGVGTNDYVLTADSTEGTGMKWAQASGGSLVDAKDACRCATTGSNITLSGTTASPLDGVTLVQDMRVLVKDQTLPEQNGIYTVNTGGAWPRATDADSSTEVTNGMYVFVGDGTVNEGTGWIVTTTGTITIGSTAINFAQMYSLPTNVVQKTLFDANTILAANSDDTPVAVTVADNRVVGRSGGNITALTGDDVLGLMTVCSQVQAEDETSTTAYAWTPQRVHQAAQDATLDGGTY